MVLPPAPRCQTARVSGRWLIIAALLCGVSIPTANAQSAADPRVDLAVTDLDPLVRSLLADIEMLSDYRVPAVLPSVFLLPQAGIEAKICDQPCNVTAAYLPKKGIYLSANLDPERDPVDRAALLHELVHYLQHGHPKFAGMSACARDRAEESEAYAIQNAYLATLHRKERVVFYDGDFDCADEKRAVPQ